MTDLQRTIEASQAIAKWIRLLLRRVVARLNGRRARCLAAS